MKRQVGVRPSAVRATLVVLSLVVSACGGAPPDDWYYHWDCNGDFDCLTLNPTGQPSGTLNEGPDQVNCTQLMRFAAINWGPAATNSCDHSPNGSSRGQLVSIVVTPADRSIAKGLSVTFRATATYSSGTTADVTGEVAWSVGTPAVAHLVGQVATGTAPGTTAIVATSGPVSGRTTLTVTPVALQSITVSPDPATVVAGATQQFTATGHYSDGAAPDLTDSATWSSSAPSVGDVAAGGLATSFSQGATTISAAFGGVTGRATLRVTAAVLQSISIAPADAQVAKGLHQQLTASGHFSDGSIVDLSAQATWTSGTPAVATVAPGGLAAALEPGLTEVTASFAGLTAATTLTVTPAALTTITVTPPSPTRPSGLSQPFTATGAYPDGTTRDLPASVAWTSGAPAVATISAGGTATTASPGTSTIAAALDGVTGSTLLTVSAATLVRIDVTPADPAITVATGIQLSAVGTYTDASTFDLTALAAWATGAPGVAAVSAGGLAFGLAAGTAPVSTTHGAVSGSTTVHVLAPGGVWTTRAAAPALGVALYGVAAAPDRLVAVGKVDIESSADGLSWAHHDAAGILNGVTWTGSAFVAVGWFENTLTNLAEVSPDGAAWSSSTWVTGALQPVFGVAWSGATFAAVGYGGGVFTSPDAGAWTARSSGTGAHLHRVAASGALLVAVGDGGTVLTSPDGVTWTARPSGTAQPLNGVTWDGARFIAVGGGGTIIDSADGIGWSPRTSGTSASLNGVASSGAGYVAVGDGGAIVASSDGLAWTAVASGTTLPLNDVAWSGARFVAVGGLTSGVILTSP